MHKEETVLNTMRKRKLQLFGQVCRMPEDWLLKTLMLRMVEGNSQPGRPREGGLMIHWCNIGAARRQGRSFGDRRQRQVEKIRG